MNWSTAILAQKKAAGLIRDFTETKNKPMELTEPNGRIVARHFQKRSKEKDYISWNLLMWCNEHALTLEEEFRFDTQKKYRADWAIPAIKILIEYEGGIFLEKSGHSNFKGQQRDITKYNLAQSLGFRVIRFNAINYQELLIELNKLL